MKGDERYAILIVKLSVAQRDEGINPALLRLSFLSQHILQKGKINKISKTFAYFIFCKD